MSIENPQSHTMNFRVPINNSFADAVNIGIPVLVTLLTVPTLRHLLARKQNLARKSESGGRDVVNTTHYQDRNGESTEASTKAFGNFRSMLTLWLGMSINLGASITVRSIANLDCRTHQAAFAQVSALDSLSSWSEILLAVCNHLIQTPTCF